MEKDSNKNKSVNTAKPRPLQYWLSNLQPATHTHYLQLGKGFTLIELLVVIVIIAILASVIFIALNPLQSFQDTRDADRKRDTTALLGAIKIDQIDNGGAYHTNISGLSVGSVYMIVDGSFMTTGCDDNNTYCGTAVSSDGSCADLSFLEDDGYFASIPFSPAGNLTWDDGNINGEEGTVYYLSISLKCRYSASLRV